MTTSSSWPATGMRLSLKTELAAWVRLPSAARPAWTLHLVGGYALEEAACAAATPGQDIGGVEVEALVAALTGVTADGPPCGDPCRGRAPQVRRPGRVFDPRGRLALMGGAEAPL